MTILKLKIFYDYLKNKILYLSISDFIDPVTSNLRPIIVRLCRHPKSDSWKFVIFKKKINQIKTLRYDLKIEILLYVEVIQQKSVEKISLEEKRYQKSFPMNLTGMIW